MGKAEVWRRLRKSAVLRKLSGVPGLQRFAKMSSLWFVSSNSFVLLPIKSGLGEGLLFTLNPRWELEFWEGKWEWPVQRVLVPYLKEETVFYDVGAGIGFYSVAAARQGASVFAFEPDQRTAQMVEYHARINKVGDRVHLTRSAVFSHNGGVRLGPTTGGSTASWGIREQSNLQQVNSYRGHTERGSRGRGMATEIPNAAFAVHSITLDEFSSQNRPPDLIKIDVEGAEAEVLKGADHILARIRPLLMCEVHDRVNYESAASCLKQKGYTFRWVEPGEGCFPRHLFARPEEQKAHELP